jgi:hypothetical protein
VPIVVREEAGIARQGEPITLGLPFPRGLVRELAQLSLRTPQGETQPLQAAATAQWTDGSLKWALLDFQVDVAPRAVAQYGIVVEGVLRPRTGHPGLQVREAEEAFEIDTGRAVFRLNRRTGALSSQARDGGAGFEAAWRMQGAGGVAAAPRVTRSWVETTGPVRTTVRLEGTFSPGDQPSCQFFAALSFFASSATARVSFTVRNPHRAQHPGNFWDLADGGSVRIRDLSLHVELAGEGRRRIQWSTHPDDAVREAADGALEIYQDSSGGPNWNSPNHVNGQGRVPTTFRGYRVRQGEAAMAGERANPLVAAWAGAFGVGAAVREFWQNFPKAIEAEPGALVVRLFPRQFGDVIELQGGEQKTHVVYLTALTEAAGLERAAWVRAPLMARTSPEWYAASGAVPYLTPAGTDANPDYLALVDQAIDGEQAFERKREIIDEYGWRNFGEIYADHESRYYTGPGPVVSHYNNQYDAVQGAVVQFMRSGDLRWFRMMDELARHVVDIDIYHTTEDRAAYNHGLFWHTNHYASAHRATHRAYSRLAGPASGGPSNEHCYSTGLLHHYFLTGDQGSRQAVLDLAQWVIDVDDGRLHRLRWLDRGPTGGASATSDPSYHGPGRGAGNSVATLLNGLLASGDRRFLDKAEEVIRRCIHPDDDIAARTLLDAERRWSYTVFLQILGRYLDLKIERDEPDAMYGYARESLLRYARWMAEHELPYLSRAETLEFPTETWSAQDMRKSDVFTLAARHSTGAEQARFLDRSEFFFRSSVNELAAAPTRAFARPVVIMMTTGYMHAAFQSRPPAPSPVPPEALTFGRPTRFVPLRARIKARAARLGALGLIAGSLLAFQWWSWA